MVVSASSADPLGPLQSALRILTALLGSLVVALVVLLPFGSSIADIGSSTVCVSAQATSLGYRSSSGDSVRGLSATAGVNVDSVSLCDRSPGVGLHALSAATVLPGLIFVFGFLALAHRMTGRAARAGLFSAGTARSVRLIGWYLGVGALSASIIEAVAAGALVGQLAPGRFTFLITTEHWRVPVAVLITSAGLITVSRVLSQAVALREEVDATI